MEERPEQPPEGKLIAAAAERMSLSIREAARRAGISYGRWRQIVTGYQNVSPGSYAEVRAPAKTLAKMAAVAGVTAEQMETEGQRPDAAEAMRGVLQWDAEHDAPPAAPVRGRELPIVASMLATPGMDDYLAGVDAERAGGGFVARDKYEAAIWMDARLDDSEKRVLIAFSRLKTDSGVRSADSADGSVGLSSQHTGLWRSSFAAKVTNA